MRTKTTLAQRLPADMEDKVVEFHRFVLRARQHCGYESSQILNMDETLMRFKLVATRTLEFTGNRTVPILSCGGDKQSFTVALTVNADGEKLPSKVIFKGVRQLRIEVPRKMQVSVHKKAQMDEEGLLFFIIFKVFNGGHDKVFERFLARSPFADITPALFTNLFGAAAQLFFLVFIVY